MSSDQQKPEKWTEIEHLPKWDEEFYEVWTGKKHGKWVMMKTLKPEYARMPEYQAMMEREFDARYNLSHPNIVMINDYEDVPGVGRCIVCDDVYGKSLRDLIDAKAVTAHHIKQLRTRLPAALQYIQENRIAHHAVSPESIIFTENIENLKLIDVGFEQRPNLTPTDAAADIRAYGRVVKQALAGLKEGEHSSTTMKHVADRCIGGHGLRRPFRDIPSLQMALDKRSDYFLWCIVAFLIVMVGILAWFISRPLSELPPDPETAAAVPTIIAD